MIRNIVLFVEDYAHQQVIGALVQRIAQECTIDVHLDWRSAVGGHGKVIAELRDYVRELEQIGSSRPDLIIVATDSNCKGFNKRRKEIGRLTTQIPVVLAVPDPHIERWLLLDGAAFSAVFGHGCQAPDRKCIRELYKRKLIEAIHAAGRTPRIGGIEYAAVIVQHMDLDRAGRADNALRQFVEDLRNTLRSWRA